MRPLAVSSVALCMVISLLQGLGRVLPSDGAVSSDLGGALKLTLGAALKGNVVCMQCTLHYVSVQGPIDTPCMVHDAYFTLKVFASCIHHIKVWELV